MQYAIENGRLVVTRDSGINIETGAVMIDRWDMDYQTARAMLAAGQFSDIPADVRAALVL